MTEKYYTPTLEEFHIGFEFESLVSTKGGTAVPKEEHHEIWKSKIATKQELSWMLVNFPNVLRVKYLDREDIESLLHINTSDFTTQFKLRESYEDSLVFQTYWIEEEEWLDEDYIYWNTKYNHIEISHKSKILFRGTLKNKSELKKLMKQLNI